MNNNCTINDIKRYFSYLMKKYPNSNIKSQTAQMYYRMFNENSRENFEKWLDNKDKK